MNIDAIDLSRHAVIEASAGTGKTYTIERLVLRILLETNTTLDQLLIVTFTEKATGELRTRLRGMLDNALAERPERRPVLQPALDQFDQAAIFTIHGFCQRVLQEYALEQGQDFRATLADDAELLPPTLRDVQRKLWRAHFGDRLRAVLEHAAFDRDRASLWDARVREVARSYQPRSDHQIRPARVADWWQRLDEAGASWPGQLQVFTVDAVRRQLAEFKRQRGLQSFDDMIANVEMNLDPAHDDDAPQLAHRLRERFRFGIVDEFQDTDPLQWRILRRVFLEAGTSRLFVVGDPKQAIFAFRGADLPTYLRARDEMLNESGAVFIPLQTNWRSAPELLDALNCLFLDGDWFPREARIEYRDVNPPRDDERQARIVQDATMRPALTIVDMRAWDRLKPAHRQYARFIAGEVQRLLHGSGGKPSLTFALKQGEPRPLEPADIGILVFRRAEAAPLTEALDDLGIPYTFYRQTGYWQSAEVRELEMVLHCLSRPEDRSAFRRALLTGFFRVTPAELVRCQDLPLSHPARKLYQDWLAFAESRRWSALFQSMLEETGLLLPALDDDGAAQRLAALRHVMSTLERVGHGENRDLLGLLDWIREKRRQRDQRDAETPPTETNRSRVRIMTIHASKGLEFPVVFLAGGFTARRNPGAVAVYRDDQDRKVFDFCPDSDAFGRMADEALAELRRLLYVALTRPMFKLYVPMVHLGSRSWSYAGAAGTVLLPALKQACPDKLGPLIADVITPPRAPEFGAATPLDDGDDAPLDGPPRLAYTGPLFPAVDPNLEWRRIVVRSFSSMSRHHVAQVGQGPSYGQRMRIARDESAGALEPEDPLRGPVFGDIVHKVLESIDFAEVGQCTQPAELLLDSAPARRLIDQEVRANIANLRGKGRDELEPIARAQIAQLVWTALHTPLAEAGVPLVQVPRADRIHELEFQLPERPGESRREEAFVMGYMDLVFRRGGRYFLVDFKTNLLAGYSPEHLARCMDDADYHRQYRIYLHALYRWLTRVHGPAVPCLERLGGVYYLFVRGLTGRDESAGVFFHRPTAEDIDLVRALQ
jgi:exodeoxyribonuclease V beta subunit